jgi:hypothetical protein
MIRSRSKRLGDLGPALAATVGLFIAPGAGQTGEPIEFSPPPVQSALPRVTPKELRPDLDMPLVKPSTGGPVIDLPASSPPDVVQSKRRLQEFWDKRDREKNWIFVSPSEFGGPRQSAESMFDVETPEDSSRPIKGSKVMERFWQAQETAERPNLKATADNHLSKPDTLEPASHTESPLDQASHRPGDKTALDWGNLFDERWPGELLLGSSGDSLSGLFDRGDRPVWSFSDDAASSERFFSRPNHRKDNFRDFQNLLKSQPSVSSLSGAGDLLNTAADATRQPINPVLSRSLQDTADSAPLQNPLGTLPGASFGNSANWVSSFGDVGGNNLNLNPAGRSPSLFRSAEPASITPKPATFEFPKRNF